jgi:hypothetical protein
VRFSVLVQTSLAPAPSLLYNGYRVSFLGVKPPGHGIDYLCPSSAEVCGWSCASTSPQCHHNADKFESEGTVWCVHKRLFWKPSTSNSPAFSAVVLQEFTPSAKKSIRQCANETPIAVHTLVDVCHSSPEFRNA